MGLGGIAAEKEHRLAVMHVIVGIGHGAVAEGAGHPVDGGGMADTGLVIHIVRAPEGGEFPLQIGPFIAGLGRAAEE